MTRNKIKIEKLEAIAARSPEQPPPAGFTEYMQELIENELAKPKAKQQPERRSLAEIIFDIESDKNKSRARKDFEIYMAQMADKMNSQTALTVSNNASPDQPQTIDGAVNLAGLIKSLRQRLN